MNNKLIGKIAYIINKQNEYYNEYGIITYYDGECYHIALWCKDLKTAKEHSGIILYRNEFRIKKE